MMKAIDAFGYSVKNLRNSSLRSMLTIIGVIIGVIALVVITSISEGVQKDVRDQLDAFGPNMLIVIPINIEGSSGMSSFSSIGQMATSGKLFERDVNAIKNILG